jgi:hypothetical protein
MTCLCRSALFRTCALFVVPLLLVFASRAAVSLRIGQNFTGSEFRRDSDALPYDGNGAPGPNDFVELINGRFSVYAKASGTRLQSMTDIAFWAQAGISLGGSLTVTDPRIIFDSNAQRWFASCIDVSANGVHQSKNHFLLAVSASADPTGAWHGFAFTADPVNGDFADFPTLGLDQSAVYLAGDLYTPLTGLHIGSTLVAMPKSDLLTAVPSVDRRISFGTLAFNAHGQVLQPAMVTGTASSGESVLAVGDLGVTGRTSTRIGFTTLAGSSATNFSLITVPLYSLPTRLAQPDGSTNLDAGDTRFSASVRRVGDTLYAVHAVANGARNALRWYRFDAPQTTLIDSGTIADPNLDLAYPSIAANDSGTVVVACNGSSFSSFVSCYAAAGETVGGTLTFGNLLLLKAGLASYQPSGGTGLSRWGDYSTTMADPSDPTRFWTIQGYPLDRSTWATQITELLTNVRLSVSLDGGNVVISWPASAVNAHLQFSPTLPPTGQWEPVTQTPTIVGGESIVTLPVSGAEGYFQLVQ